MRHGLPWRSLGRVCPQGAPPPQRHPRRPIRLRPGNARASSPAHCANARLNLTLPIAARHHPGDGSVQQGLSAAGGALGFYQLGLAADKPYSFDCMKIGESRALYSTAYLAALLLCVALGRMLTTFAGIHPGGSSAGFFGVVAAAGVVLCVGLFVEERLLWARVPGREAERPEFIGKSRGTLLTGFAPPPVSLGLALGMFSSLVM